MVDELRLTDADREQAAATIRNAFAEGRLDDVELTDRLEQAYRAKTQSELTPVFTGLPVPAPPPPPVPERTSRVGKYIFPAISPFVAAMVICTFIWAVTTRGYFWPMWVYLGCGTAIFFTVVGMRQFD